MILNTNQLKQVWNFRQKQNTKNFQEVTCTLSIFT